MKLVITLAAVCVIAGLILGITYDLTAEKIKYQEELAEKNAVKAVLPAAADFSEKITKDAVEYYRGLDQSKAVMGYAILGEAKGYSSTIKAIVGLDRDKKVQAVKIISQQETPGLGVRIEEPGFLGQFAEKNIDDVQTITGATISSKAVKKIVQTAEEQAAGLD